MGASPLFVFLSQPCLPPFKLLYIYLAILNLQIRDTDFFCFLGFDTHPYEGEA
jgi:hypothetical protein